MKRTPVKQVAKKLWWKAMSEGDISFGKFNVTPDCICSQPIRILVNSVQGKSQHQRTVLGSMWEYPDVILLKTGLSCGESGPPSNIYFLGPTHDKISNRIRIGSVTFARLNDSWSWLTDRLTDRPRYSIYSNRPHLASAAISLIKTGSSNSSIDSISLV